MPDRADTDEPPAHSAGGPDDSRDGVQSDAVTQLQESTQRLSDQQATVSEEMGQTAESLSDAGARSPARLDSGTTGAVADD